MHGLFAPLMAAGFESRESALVELLGRLKRAGYRFTTVTPATHERILARPTSGPLSLRDIFGWNRGFVEDDLDWPFLELLDQAGALSRTSAGLRSQVRVASLREDLFLHSAFPTDEADAVFFGPDTYRFARFIQEELPRLPGPKRIVDMGTGSGAGGLTCLRLRPESLVTLVDINERALRFARINAAAAGVTVECRLASEMPGGIDLVVANPPYMIDPARRAYRDGGDLFGGAIALDWVRQALAALAPGGTMLLYTGAAFVNRRSPALEAVAAECAGQGASFACREIDPDVFGEELEKPGYEQVERIAAVGCVIRRDSLPATSPAT